MDTAFKLITSIVRETVVPVVGESVRIAPDALLWGTGLLSFLTQSYPLAILFIAIIEITVGCRLTGSFIKAVRPDLQATATSCRQGFSTGSLAFLAGATSVGAAGAAALPHFTLVLLTAVGVYLITGMYSKIDTLEALGESWTARIPTSLSLFVVVIATYIFGLYSNGCITLGNVLLSLIAGTVLGLAAYFLNTALFGDEATNFHGLPLLINKIKEGEPIYVCSRS